MYTLQQIKALQTNNDFFISEGDKYCLVSMIGRELSKEDVNNQANFCILQIIDAYKKNYLTSSQANDLINKVDVFEYSTDLLGPKKVIYKINKEIIEDSLHIPHFNSLCVLCGDLYDSD